MIKDIVVWVVSRTARRHSQVAVTRIATAATALLILAGCGSTVSLGASGSQSNDDGLGTAISAPVSAAPAAPCLSSGPSGSTSTDSAGTAPTAAIAAGSATATSSGESSSTASGPTTTSIPATGRGWDKSYVYIGVDTQNDVASATKALGAKGVDGGDTKAQALAIATAINNAGGIFGRKIQVLTRDHSTVAATDDPAGTGAATCTYWTQDKPVIAVINPVTLIDVSSFRSCMAKAHVPLFSGSVAAVDSTISHALAPYFYQDSAPAWDNLSPTFISRLKAEGWFDGWNTTTSKTVPGKVRVGIIISPDNDSIRIGNRLAAAFKQAGAASVEISQVKTSSDASSAVLHFRSDGVTGVVGTDVNLGPFIAAASEQKYYPRYGLSSYNAPQAFLESNAPKATLVGAVGVGWAPALDVEDAHDPGDVGPGETMCKKWLAAGGQTFSGMRLALAVALSMCDAFRLIADGAQAGGGFTGQQLATGIQIVGPNFQQAFSFRSGIGNGRLFIPGAVRDLIYQTSCQCFQYGSKTNYLLF